MYCEKCKVTVRGEYERCPLCQQKLKGEAGEGIFPEPMPETKKIKSFLRLCSFASVVVLVLCVAINFSLPDYGWWSIFVLAGMVSLWILLGVLINKKDNILKTMIWQAAIISALAAAWDLFTGFRGWSVEFVIPILLTATMAAMALFAQITRLRQEDYLIYLVIDSSWGLLCVLFIVFNVAEIVIPSIICVCASVISLSALNIFEGRALRAELRRRLHL